MHYNVDDFRLGDRAMRYSLFVPRLYNYCLSLGFQRSRMMPSRAFCSDESQGYPVILLMQHFGTFPFDHGLIGGAVAIDRHGPYAHHGEDLIILQASHVGYDPAHEQFGCYPRHRTDGQRYGDNCGKLSAVLQWYQHEYDTARQSVQVGTINDRPNLFIDNNLLNQTRASGLFLQLDQLIAGDLGSPTRVFSTARSFAVSQRLIDRLPPGIWAGGRTPLGDWLTADLFRFCRDLPQGPEGHDLLEAALAPFMPALVTSPRPALDAARNHTQVEFDRTYRSIRGEPAFRGKNLLFIAGLNIDVAPPEGMPFPLTKFVPWAAYVQRRDGTAIVMEQDELTGALLHQPTTNPDQLSFDAAIAAMEDVESISIPQ